MLRSPQEFLDDYTGSVKCVIAAEENTVMHGLSATSPLFIEFDNKQESAYTYHQIIKE